MFPRLESLDERDYAFHPQQSSVTLSTQDNTYVNQSKQHPLKVVVSKFGDEASSEMQASFGFDLKNKNSQFMAEEEMQSLLRQAYSKLIMAKELHKFMFVFKRCQGDDDQLVEFNYRNLLEWVSMQNSRTAASTSPSASQESCQHEKGVLRLELITKSEYSLMMKRGYHPDFRSDKRPAF